MLFAVMTITDKNIYKDIKHTNIEVAGGHNSFSPILNRKLITSYFIFPPSHLLFLYNRDNLTSKIEFIQKLRKLEQKTDILKRIRKITSELKSNGAYSQKNIELEHNQLVNAGATLDELQIIKETWENKRKLCKQLWQDLKELNKIFKEVFKDGNN